MIRTSLAVLALSTLACAAPPEPSRTEQDPLALLLGGEAQTYVLVGAESQRGEPVFTFDHRCAGIHRQTAVRDTIELRPDGSARRAMFIQRLENGVATTSTSIVATGTWVAGVRSAQSEAGVTLQLAPMGAPSYSLPLRLRRGGQAVARLAMGGVCSGSRDDSRVAEATYERR